MFLDLVNTINIKIKILHSNRHIKIMKKFWLKMEHERVRVQGRTETADAYR